jgi:hypothetical protein
MHKKREVNTQDEHDEAKERRPRRATTKRGDEMVQQGGSVPLTRTRKKWSGSRRRFKKRHEWQPSQKALLVGNR